jgi:hypothetical protein
MPSESRRSQAIGKTTGSRGRATAAVCRRNISVQWPTPNHLPRYKKRMRLTKSTHTCSNKEHNTKILLGCHSVWLIRTDVSEERSASIIRADEFVYPDNGGRGFV